jgi:ADP-ribosyl-[dinitrogen reductase] hydrolase
MDSNRLNNRIYGLLIGGALADAVGSIAEIMPGHTIRQLNDGQAIGILPGYWQQSTATFLALADALLQPDPKAAFRHNLQQPARFTSDGVYSNLDQGTLAFINTGRSTSLDLNAGALVRTGAVALVHFNSYLDLLNASYTCCKYSHAAVLCADACKLYTAILDGILHGHSKADVLNPLMYSNLDLDDTIKSLLTNQDSLLSHLNVDDDVLPVLVLVLSAFKKTNSYHQGLDFVLKQTHSVYAIVVYGQIAGAYYGLTDIKKDWLAQLVRPDLFMDFAEKIITRIIV